MALRKESVTDVCLLLASGRKKEVKISQKITVLYMKSTWRFYHSVKPFH